jgi:Spy/CpxP family protein refolding chaperone
MRVSWRNHVVPAALVAAALAGAGGALAGPPGGGCGAGGSPLGHLEHQVARAGLPPETAQAVYARLDQARAERRAIEGSLATAHEQMRTLLGQDAASIDAVMAQADAVGALETQMRKLDLQALVQIRSLVTPEQWEALAPKRPGPPRGEGEDPRS